MLKPEQLLPVVDTRNLVGHWKLYDHTYFDYSLNGNSGTAANTAVADRGIAFDGADSIVTVAADSTIDINGKTVLSISAWINPASDGEGNVGKVVDKLNAGGTAGYWLGVQNEVAGLLKYKFEIKYDGASDVQGITDSAVIPINTWSHIVVSFNRASDLKPELYLNGALQTITAIAGVGSPDDDSAAGLIIGNSVAVDNTFDGTLSDIRIYNKALSAAETKNIYSLTRGRYGV